MPLPDISSMPCPLCGAVLAERGPTGRFHCAACFATSEESRRGWIPRARRIAPDGTVVGGLTSLAAAIAGDKTFGLGADGKQITRERTCECGQRFTQIQLSERFLTIAETFSAQAIAAVTRQIPGFYVPVHCPRCERVDLRRQGYIDEQNRIPEDRDVAAD